MVEDSWMYHYCVGVVALFVRFCLAFGWVDENILVGLIGVL